MNGIVYFHAMTTRMTHIHRLFFALLLLRALSSCNNVEQQVTNVKQTLQDEDEESRKAYQTAYQQAMGAATDTAIRSGLGGWTAV